MDMGLQLDDREEVQVWDGIYKELSGPEELHGENTSETARKVSRRQQIRMQTVSAFMSKTANPARIFR